MKARIGEKGYKTGSPSLSLPAYDDRWPDRSEYLSMMKQTLLLSRSCSGGTSFRISTAGCTRTCGC